MLCEECHQNEAVYTISVMMGEAMTQRHLCADCMAKMNMNIASGNMQKLLGAILNAINRGEQPEEGEKVPDDQPDITCPRCRCKFMGAYSTRGASRCSPRPTSAAAMSRKN